MKLEVSVMGYKNLKIDIDKINEFIEDLRIESRTSPIIVEGDKDIKTLKKFDINNVHQIKSSVIVFAESIAENNKSVILLTDLDRTGEELHNLLLQAFQKLGVKVIDKFRIKMKGLNLTHVEGLFSRYKNIKEKWR